MKPFNRTALALGVALLAGIVTGRLTADWFTKKPRSVSYAITRSRLLEIQDRLVGLIDAAAGKDPGLRSLNDLKGIYPEDSILRDGWGNPFVLARHEYKGDVYYEVYSLDTLALVRPSYQYRTIHAYVQTRNGEIVNFGVSGPAWVAP